MLGTERRRRNGNILLMYINIKNTCALFFIAFLPRQPHDGSEFINIIFNLMISFFPEDFKLAPFSEHPRDEKLSRPKGIFNKPMISSLIIHRPHPPMKQLWVIRNIIHNKMAPEEGKTTQEMSIQPFFRSTWATQLTSASWNPRALLIN